MLKSVEKRTHLPECLACQIDALNIELKIISDILLQLDPVLRDNVSNETLFSFKSWIGQFRQLCKIGEIDNLLHSSVTCFLKSDAEVRSSDAKEKFKGSSTQRTLNHRCSPFANWISKNFDIPVTTNIEPEISANPINTKDEVIKPSVPKTLGEMIKRKNEIDAISNDVSSALNSSKRFSSGANKNSKHNCEIITIDRDDETCQEQNRKITVRYNDLNDTEEIMLVEEVCSKKNLNTQSKQRTNQRRVVIEECQDDELEEIYARVPCLAARAPRKEEHFISTDERENQDNIDARWSELKKLRSDSELHTYARAAFGNREVSDPNRCLSYQGFKRKEFYKRKHVKMKTNRYHFEDVKIEKGWIKSLDYWDNLVDNKNKKRKAVEDAYGAPQPKRQRLITFDLYEKSMRKELFKRQINTDTKYIKYIVRHFKKSIEETKSFLRMYSNQHENSGERVYMTEDELNCNCCIEMIFRQSVQYYGDNPLQKCSDCSEMDKENISHPY